MKMSDIYNNEEMLNDFNMEAEQLIELLESNILSINNNADNKAAIDEIFRAFHSIKGSASVVDYFILSEYAHKVEDVLDTLRKYNYFMSKDIADELLSILDIIKLLIKTDQVKKEVLENSLNLLRKALPNEAQNAINTSNTIKKNNANSYNILENEALIVKLSEVSPAYHSLFKLDISVNSSDDSLMFITLYKELSKIGQVLYTDPNFETICTKDITKAIFYCAISNDIDPTFNLINQYCEQSLNHNQTKIEKIAINSRINLFITNENSNDDEGIKKIDSRDYTNNLNHSNYVKIETSKIEYLYNLNSEMMIIKNSFSMLQQNLSIAQLNLHKMKLENFEILHKIENSIKTQLSQIGKNSDSLELSKIFNPSYQVFNYFENLLKDSSYNLKLALNEFNKINNDNHHTLLKMRMLPISNVFNRFPRLVRDLSKKLDKEVYLDIIGKEVELDKGIIEVLYDSILHCVRNSMDHGIESKEERLASDKNPIATITLKATNQGNNILIEISDDGRGVDEVKVRAKAIEKGLIKENIVLSNQEIYNLIMLAGFSTTQNITSISGRGVGLDVLKNSIESLSGDIMIASKTGVGTTISIKLPITLSVIESLMIRVEDQIYAMPINNILESFYISDKDITYLNNCPILNIKSRAMPVFYLRKLFNIEKTDEDNNKDKYYVIIIESQSKQIALLVDDLLGKEDVVLKALDGFTSVLGVSGATIMGDGSICLVIDTMQVFQLSHIQKTD